MHEKIPKEENLSDIKAIVFALVAYLCFSLADSLVKYVGAHVETFIILFWDGCFIILLMGCYVLLGKGWSAIKTDKLKFHLIKGVFSTIMAWLAIYGVTVTSLSEFYMLAFTAPMWVVVFSMLMLKERFDIKRVFFVLVGFAVIIWTVLPPDGQLLSIDKGTLAVLAFAMGIGFNMIFIRKYLKGETVALLGGFNSLVIVASLFWYALPRTDAEVISFMPHMALIGFFVFYAIVTLSKAYHIVSHAAVIAPFHYSQMLYGVLIGYFVFSEVPSSRTLIGSVALLIIGLGLFWYDYNNNKNLKRYA